MDWRLSDPIEALITTVLKIFQQESTLLENLKRMHALDKLDIDAIYYLYQKLEQADCDGLNRIDPDLIWSAQVQW